MRLRQRPQDAAQDAEEKSRLVLNVPHSGKVTVPACTTCTHPHTPSCPLQRWPSAQQLLEADPEVHGHLDKLGYPLFNLCTCFPVWKPRYFIACGGYLFRFADEHVRMRLSRTAHPMCALSLLLPSYTCAIAQAERPKGCAAAVACAHRAHLAHRAACPSPWTRRRSSPLRTLADTASLCRHCAKSWSFARAPPASAMRGCSSCTVPRRGRFGRRLATRRAAAPSAWRRGYAVCRMHVLACGNKTLTRHVVQAGEEMFAAKLVQERREASLEMNTLAGPAAGVLPPTL